MPSTWRQIALPYLATVETGSKDTVNAVEDGEHPFIVRSAEPFAIDTFTFDTEAILTAGDGAVGEIFHHVKGKFDAHQRVYVIHGFQGIDGRYLYWYFLSEFRRAVSYGGAQTTVASLRYASAMSTSPATPRPSASAARGSALAAEADTGFRAAWRAAVNRVMLRRAWAAGAAPSGDRPASGTPPPSVAC